MTAGRFITAISALTHSVSQIPKQMIDELHAKGFKVTAWVIPFLDPQSQAFAEGAKNGWLVRTADGSPYLVEWWQGRGGLLDVTNPSALEWFFERLTSLQLEVRIRRLQI